MATDTIELELTLYISNLVLVDGAVRWWKFPDFLLEMFALSVYPKLCFKHYNSYTLIYENKFVANIRMFTTGFY